MDNTNITSSELSKNDYERDISRLKEYFKDKGNAVLAIIFGSFASRRLKLQSDIDIAVLFVAPPQADELSQMSNEISDITGIQADMVVLNGSSPVIGLQALKNGVLIKGAQTLALFNYITKITKEYDDLKFIRKEAEEKLLGGSAHA